MTEYTEVPASSAEWIDASIRAALPRDGGWHVSYRIARASAHKPARAATVQDYEWKIWHDDFDRDGWIPGLTYYTAFVDGRDNLVLTYANSDTGVSNPSNTPQTALLLPLENVVALLARVLSAVETYPPNRYGHS
jgi:hypothetical protein